jgi:YesN/AraC family two-component response regulator
MTKFKLLLTNSLFKKYFLNYLLVFLLPFLILTSILYGILDGHLKKQLIADNQITLTQVYQAIEAEFTALDKISDDLAANTNLNTYYLKDPLYTNRAKNELQRYMITNKALVKEIFIYYGQKEVLYSHAGTLSEEAFINFKYPKTTLTAAALDRNFKTQQQLLTRNDFLNPKQGQLLQYYVPIKTTPTKLTILYIFDQQKFKDLLARFHLHPGQDITLYQDGHLFATSAKDLKQLSKDTDRISAQKKLGGIQIKVRMDKHLLVQRLNNLRITFIVICLASLFLGVVLIFLISRHSYTPIAKLNEEFDKIVKADLYNDIEGDLFLNVSKHLSNQHKVIQAEFEHHQELLKDIFWNDLIHGILTTPSEIAAKMAESGLKENPTATYFLGLISTNFSTDRLDNIKQTTVIIKKLKQAHTNFTTHLVEMPFDNRLAVIFELHQDQTLTPAIQDWLIELLPLKAEMFFSQAKHQLLDITTAYIEATTILAHTDFAKSNQQLHFYNSSELSKTATFDFNQNNILKLIAAIKENSTPLIETTLKELTEENHLSTLPLNMHQHYSSHLFNSLIALINQEKLPMTENIFKHLNHPIITPQLYPTLLALSLEIAGNIANLKNSNSYMHKLAIMNYLQENFKNPDFSLESFAATFNVSTTFLTKFIKQETGLSFAKVVGQLKLDYIKLELTTTDRPIKQIIFDVGYYDVSNFTRKFRKLTGLTPGNYRKERTEADHAEKNAALWNSSGTDYSSL